MFLRYKPLVIFLWTVKVSSVSNLYPLPLSNSTMMPSLSPGHFGTCCCRTSGWIEANTKAATTNRCTTWKSHYKWLPVKSFLQCGVSQQTFKCTCRIFSIALGKCFVELRWAIVVPWASCSSFPEKVKSKNVTIKRWHQSCSHREQWVRSMTKCKSEERLCLCDMAYYEDV